MFSDSVCVILLFLIIFNLYILKAIIKSDWKVRLNFMPKNNYSIFNMGLVEVHSRPMEWTICRKVKLKPKLFPF